MKLQVRPMTAQGFGLIEMLLALSITAFGLLAAGQLLYVAAGSNSLARSKSTAALAAQNMMESLGALYRQNPSAPDLTLGDHGPRSIQVANPTDGTILNRFNVTWVVENVPDPRPGKALDARLVRTTVTPVLDKGTENNQPGLNKILNVITVFSPRM